MRELLHVKVFLMGDKSEQPADSGSQSFLEFAREDPILQPVPAARPLSLLRHRRNKSITTADALALGSAHFPGPAEDLGGSDNVPLVSLPDGTSARLDEITEAYIKHTESSNTRDDTHERVASPPRRRIQLPDGKSVEMDDMINEYVRLKDARRKQGRFDPPKDAVNPEDSDNVESDDTESDEPISSDSERKTKSRKKKQSVAQSKKRLCGLRRRLVVELLIIALVISATLYYIWNPATCALVATLNHGKRSNHEIDRVVQLDVQLIDSYIKARTEFSAGRGPSSVLFSSADYERPEPVMDTILSEITAPDGSHYKNNYAGVHAGESNQLQVSPSPNSANGPLISPAAAVQLFSANVGARFDCETFYQFIPEDGIIRGKDMCWDTLYEIALTNNFYNIAFLRNINQVISTTPGLLGSGDIAKLQNDVSNYDKIAAEKRHILRNMPDAYKEWERHRLAKESEYRCLCNEHVGIVNRFAMVCGKGEDSGYTENCMFFIDPSVEPNNGSKIVTSVVDPGGEFSIIDAAFRTKLRIENDGKLRRRAKPLWRYKTLPAKEIMEKYYGSDLGIAPKAFLIAYGNHKSIRSHKGLFSLMGYVDGIEERCQPGISKRRSLQDVVYLRNTHARDMETRLNLLSQKATFHPSKDFMAGAAAGIKSAFRSSEAVCDNFYRSINSLNETSDEMLLSQSTECMKKIMARPELVEIVDIVPDRASACLTHCQRLSERMDADRALMAVYRNYPASAPDMIKYITELNREFAFSKRM